MKKEYKKPNIALFSTKCHVSTLSPDKPEEIDGSKRSLLVKGGLIVAVGHLTLLHASGGGDDGGRESVTTNSWTGEPIKK